MSAPGETDEIRCRGCRELLEPEDAYAMLKITAASAFAGAWAFCSPDCLHDSAAAFMVLEHIAEDGLENPEREPAS